MYTTKYTTKLLEDNLKENSEDLRYGDHFFKIQHQKHNP
jgi:hypothetical protein